MGDRNLTIKIWHRQKNVNIIEYNLTFETATLKKISKTSLTIFTKAIVNTSTIFQQRKPYATVCIHSNF